MNKCIVCGSEIVSKREDIKTCSSRCRKALQRGQVAKIKCDTERLKCDKLSVTQIKCDKDSVSSPEPYVIPMTRKAAIEICKAVAIRGDGAPLTGDVKRRAFSALHNTLDCRYIEV